MKENLNSSKRMKLKIKIYILMILAVLAIILFSIFTENSLFSASKQNTVCFEEKCFKVEKAITSEERTTGLMSRTSLDENKGMLFVFETEDIYGFWMKNTYIPLDMIWINDNDEVIFIYRNAEPCKEVCNSIIPTSKAKYVLEINAGLVSKYNITVGDKVKIN